MGVIPSLLAFMLPDKDLSRIYGGDSAFLFITNIARVVCDILIVQKIAVNSSIISKEF